MASRSRARRSCSSTVCCSSLMAVSRALMRSSKLLASSSTANLVWAMALLVSALTKLNSRSSSLRAFMRFCNSPAALVSATISSVMPENEFFTSSSAPEKSPRKNFTKAPPKDEMRSLITANAAPNASVATLSCSAPRLVFVKNDTSDPIATSSNPTPVAASATLKVFNPVTAVLRPPENLRKPVMAPPVILSSWLVRPDVADVTSSTDFSVCWSPLLMPPVSALNSRMTCCLVTAI